MAGCIRAIRVLLSSILVLLLSLTVIIGIPLAALAHTVTNRDNIKSLIHDINLYDDAIDIATGFITTTEEGETPENSILTELADPGSTVRSSIESIVTPQFLERSVNTIVDAVYDWASGKTTRPEFTVSVTNDTDTLMDLLSIGFTQKLEGLPACPSDFEVPSDFDPLGTECLPEGFNTNEVDTFLKENSDAPEFQQLLDQFTFDSSSLEIPEETTATVQQVYSIAQILPYIVLGLWVVLSLLIVIATPSLTGGATAIAISTLIPSIFLGIISFLDSIFYAYLSESTSNQIAADVPDEARVYILNAIHAAFSLFARDIRIYSVIGIVLGLAVLVAGIILKGVGKTPKMEIPKLATGPSIPKSTSGKDTKPEKEPKENATPPAGQR